MFYTRIKPLIERLVPGAAGIGAALATRPLAAKKKDGDGETARDGGKERDGKDDDRADRQSTDANRDDADGAGGGGKERSERQRQEAERDDDGGRQRFRQRDDDGDSGDAEANARRGDVDGIQETTTTTTRDDITTTTTTTTIPASDTSASIVDPDGDVIAGFDPETETLIARSGDVTALVGPDGPMVIIDDEEVVPVTALPPEDVDDRPEPEPPAEDPSGGDDVEILS